MVVVTSHETEASQSVLGQQSSQETIPHLAVGRISRQVITVNPATSPWCFSDLFQSADYERFSC